tara:strand:- start:961 stop:1374 length:414 start_codon:yes stop_codon:yes gene_type:complete
MSTLSVATIKNTGSGQPVFRDSSNNLVGQLVQVWVNFAGGRSGLTPFGIRASNGVSSVTDNGNGDFTVNFTTAFASAGSYCCTCNSREDNAGAVGDHSTYFQRVLSYTQAGSIRFRTGTTSGASDNDQIWLTCIGTQ